MTALSGSKWCVPFSLFFLVSVYRDRPSFVPVVCGGGLDVKLLPFSPFVYFGAPDTTLIPFFFQPKHLFSGKRKGGKTNRR